MVKVSKFIHKKDFFQFTYIRFGYTEGQGPGAGGRDQKMAEDQIN